MSSRSWWRRSASVASGSRPSRSPSGRAPSSMRCFAGPGWRNPYSGACVKRRRGRMCPGWRRCCTRPACVAVLPTPSLRYPNCTGAPRFWRKPRAWHLRPRIAADHSPGCVKCGIGWRQPACAARRSAMKPRGLPDPSDPTAVRLPPQNLEAEKAVLGAILLDNQALYKALEVISSDEFYLPKHRRIFEAMITLLTEQNQVVDLVTLSDHLQHAGALEGVGGSAYLTDLAQAVATAASVTYHAKLIHETGINHILINVSTEIVTRGYEGTKRVDELLDYAERNIFGIAERRLKRSFSPMGAVVTDTVEHINKLYEQKEKITGIPTGFSDLNDKTAGLQSSDLIVVAGRPSTGKTSLALGMALHAALHSSRPSKVAIFSLEMSKEQLCMRLLSAEGRVDMHRIRTGQLQREDWPNLTRAASKLSESKIYIDDA